MASAARNKKNAGHGISHLGSSGLEDPKLGIQTGRPGGEGKKPKPQNGFFSLRTDQTAQKSADFHSVNFGNSRRL